MKKYDRKLVVANFRNRGHSTNDHREKKKKRKTNKYLEESDLSDSSDSSSSDESDEESYEAKRHRHRKKKSRKKDKKHNKRKRDNGRAKEMKNRKWMKNAKCHHSITSESGYNGDSSPAVSSSSMQYDENLVDNSQVAHHDDHECNDTSYDWSPAFVTNTTVTREGMCIAFPCFSIISQ